MNSLTGTLAPVMQQTVMSESFQITYVFMSIIGLERTCSLAAQGMLD